MLFPLDGHHGHCRKLIPSANAPDYPHLLCAFGRCDRNPSSSPAARTANAERIFIYGTLSLIDSLRVRRDDSDEFESLRRAK
jgi:hypothetical protein